MYRTCILDISDKDNDGKLSKAELKLLLLSRRWCEKKYPIKKLRCGIQRIYNYYTII